MLLRSITHFAAKSRGRFFEVLRIHFGEHRSVERPQKAPSLVAIHWPIYFLVIKRLQIRQTPEVQSFAEEKRKDAPIWLLPGGPVTAS
jgi:hypothetical protein